MAWKTLKWSRRFFLRLVCELDLRCDFEWFEFERHALICKCVISHVCMCVFFWREMLWTSFQMLWILTCSFWCTRVHGTRVSSFLFQFLIFLGKRLKKKCVFKGVCGLLLFFIFIFVLGFIKCVCICQVEYSWNYMISACSLTW